ncbi:family 78 glycoside hydrolase catalytic domain [Jiangella alkaliphila]|uniref:alpha-L-rhamnosidase n=1 Tax=Jiangella alkaliphila TaxID=419479 RepID=A0A1H2K373_9ACTN|nr:family 78 glycoside hydrolase catalytic domain [Jiangella alkaliphila]SDU63157.1 alpha-L-rhamnosidase [Jiangella alkaliphila]
MNEPTQLRVEHLSEPLGLDVRRPRLSWLLPLDAAEQVAYRIRAGAWDSGRVESRQSVLVPYGGPELASGQRVTWRVKVWTDAGESRWSGPAIWEMGLLDEGDWTADWIEPAEAASVRAQILHPAYLLRREFTLDAPVETARLHVTAHGLYEVYLNGRRVGDVELTPGFTSYSSTVQVQTFDVGAMLRPGANVLGAVLSDGWFRGQATGFRHVRSYGDAVALLAQLQVRGSDGGTRVVASGADWSFLPGPIVSADLYEGQVVDLRRDRADWCQPGAVRDGWSPVVVREHGFGRLRWSPAPPVRRVEELRPRAVHRPRHGRHVFDLGQNINGWARLTRLGPPGTSLVLTHAEAVDADGNATTATLTPDTDVIPTADGWPWDTSILKRPLQVDEVTSAGRTGDVFEPRHTTHGFRYVQIDGYPGDLDVDDVTGAVVHTDLRRTGWFACSDERVNRLHQAAVWSLRGNACDIPTDCPTRERAGWTGDWQVFVASAAFLYDVAGFSAKWLRDLASDQWRDGTVQHFAPNPVPMDMPGNPIPPGSAGWGDAAVIVPWEIYRAYGDAGVLEEQWPSMTAWVDRGARAARDHRHPDRVAVRPSTAAHERYLWDTGFHFGEWLEPEVPEFDPIALVAEDHGDLASAYLHHSADLLSRSAAVLGRTGDADRYGELAAAVKAAWQQEFLGADGALLRDTQAAHVRALAFGLVPDELRDSVAQRLVQLVREAGTHLTTGFLSTGYLLPVLAETGHVDVAYELLFQDTEPSWLTMIDRGATTIWEDWRGIDENGAALLSLNHYSKGAVISFLHRHTAGLTPIDDQPGYRRFRVAPQPGGGLTHARAIHDSPYGPISVAWRSDGETFTLHVSVPPGATADVILPDGDTFVAGPGRVRRTCAVDMNRFGPAGAVV